MISIDVAVSMAALLALDDLENGRTEEAKRTLEYLVHKIGVSDLMDHISKRVNLKERGNV